jgi:2-dehydropantoate 2-reductase
MTRIAVLGCGAMGSIYAGLLASAGHEVICISRNTRHVAAINKNGLRVSGASGDRTVQVRAVTQAPNDKVEVLVIGLKARDIPSVVEAKHMLNEQSIIVTIQNGLGSAETVAKLLGKEQLVVGIAQGFGASLPEPGHSHHNGMKALRLGAYAAGSDSHVTRVARMFTDAGFDTEPSQDITAVQWEKLICNVAYSGPCALTGMTVGEMMDDPIMGEVSRAAAVEAYEIANLRNIKISFTDPIAYVRDFAARMPAAKPSVLLDIEAARRSEIAVINGAVAREAAKVGTTAPINATITALVQTLEKNFR